MDVALATIATGASEGEPVWFYIVGPPSSGKTEPLRAFKDLPSVFFLSSMSPNSLVSGFTTKEEDTDLLPKLNGKTLLIKDFTVTLQMTASSRDALLGVLRDAYDGEFS